MLAPQTATNTQPCALISPPTFRPRDDASIAARSRTSSRAIASSTFKPASWIDGERSLRRRVSQDRRDGPNVHTGGQETRLGRGATLRSIGHDGRFPATFCDSRRPLGEADGGPTNNEIPVKCRGSFRCRTTRCTCDAAARRSAQSPSLRRSPRRGRSARRPRFHRPSAPG